VPQVFIRKDSTTEVNWSKDYSLSGLITYTKQSTSVLPIKFISSLVYSVWSGLEAVTK